MEVGAPASGGADRELAAGADMAEATRLLRDIRDQGRTPAPMPTLTPDRGSPMR